MPTRNAKVGAKSGRGTKNPAVDAWFASYDNPQKETMQAVRAAILAADPRIGEVVKWSTPTFVYEGNFASFQPKAKQFASLLVHNGAKIPGRHALLKGDGAMVRTVQFDSVADVKRKQAALKTLVKAWCDWREA